MNSKKSSTSNFLLDVVVPFFVSFKDIFETTQHSLETFSVDWGNSAPVDCLDASLSTDIVKKSQLAEVVSLFILINDSWEFIMGFFLFGDQTAF